MGGVGRGRFVAISPLLKTGGHALKAAFVTEGFPVHHLTVENSPSVAAKTWAVGMFKLRAKNNVHHQKESELAKKKRPLPALSYLCLPIVPVAQITRKDVHGTPILLRTSATDNPLHRPATRKETPHNKLP